MQKSWSFGQWDMLSSILSSACCAKIKKESCFSDWKIAFVKNLRVEGESIIVSRRFYCNSSCSYLSYGGLQLACVSHPNFSFFYGLFLLASEGGKEEDALEELEFFVLPKMPWWVGFSRHIRVWWGVVGRQAWRLIHDDESVLGKVIKAKYYRHSSFLDSPLGSYTWKSSWGSKALVKEGPSFCLITKLLLVGCQKVQFS